MPQDTVAVLPNRKIKAGDTDTQKGIAQGFRLFKHKIISLECQCDLGFSQFRTSRISSGILR